MYVLTARYVGATDTSGSRHVVRWGDLRAIIPYDHAARDAGIAAIRRALIERPAFAEHAARNALSPDDLRYGTDASTGATVGIFVR